MRSLDPSRRSRLKHLAVIIGGLACVLGFTSLNQAQTTLRKIEIVGLQRVSSEQAVQTSGLRVGQTVNANLIDAAAQKLMQSGMFRSVSYRVSTADNDTTVTFEVEESPVGGPATTEALGQVKWTGNIVLSNQELSSAFVLKSGDPADRAKIEKGLEAVRKEYARKGYVAAKVFELKTRDDLNRRTNYEFAVREGQQHRMGEVIITGLTPEETRRLKAKWTLAAGAVFDDSYLDNFRQTVIRPFVIERTQRTGARSKFDVATRPDAQRLTVDVLITFK